MYNHNLMFVKVIGVSLSEPHTSVVYESMCIDRTTDHVCPIHVIRIRCTCPRWEAI